MQPGDQMRSQTQFVGVADQYSNVVLYADVCYVTNQDLGDIVSGGERITVGEIEPYAPALTEGY